MQKANSYKNKCINITSYQDHNRIFVGIETKDNLTNLLKYFQVQDYVAVSNIEDNYETSDKFLIDGARRATYRYVEPLVSGVTERHPINLLHIQNNILYIYIYIRYNQQN